MPLLKAITVGRLFQTVPIDTYLAQGYAITPSTSRYASHISNLQYFKSMAGAPTLKDPISSNRGIIKNYNL